MPDSIKLEGDDPRPRKRSALKSILEFIVLGVVFAILYFGMPHIRSVLFVYETSQIRAEDLAEVHFTCVPSGRSRVIRDPERLEIVATMFRELQSSTDLPKDYSGSNLKSRVVLKDRRFLTGYWNICMAPYSVSYEPEGTIEDFDQGTLYHTSAMRKDEEIVALIEELANLCEAPHDGD